jgi:DNA-binding response OmpR family regulator
VIDDNRDGADMMALLVQEQGGQVRTAYDGSAGILAAKEFDAEFILLDIGMPDMDGYETCRQLRAELGRAVRIIALTGWGQEQDKRRALESGFDHHLTKPAGPEQLAEAVRSLKRKSA